MKETPVCYHTHPTTDFSSSDHTFKGSLMRHITVERIFCFLSKPVTIMWRKTGSYKVYRLLKCPFEIVFGLNMNLPIKDVLDWSCYYYLRDGEPIPT